MAYDSRTLGSRLLQQAAAAALPAAFNIALHPGAWRAGNMANASKEYPDCIVCGYTRLTVGAGETANPETARCQ